MDTQALLLGVGIGLGMALLLMIGMAVSRAGSWGGAMWGLTVAGRANQDAALKAKIDAALGTATPVAATGPAAPPKPSGEPLRLLAVLQAEARLLDFLLDTLPPELPKDAAMEQKLLDAVRLVHPKAAATLRKYVTFEPVMGGADGDRVTVAKGFDPSAVRLTGNVTGEAPFSGELQHGGWRVKQYTLPPIADGQDPMVMQPAEVQI